MAKAEKIQKTNAIRILEGKNIQFEASVYEDNTDHKLELGAAERTAEKLGVEPECVFKTIVMMSDKKEILVFCQSAVSEINLKKARNLAGVSDVSPVKPDDLLKLTGYVRGGCSPIGMKKQYRTFIDEMATLCDKVYVSAGVRGMQICLSPADLIEVTGAVVGDLAL